MPVEQKAVIEKKKGRVLLPTDIVPTKYDVNLAVDIERFVFDGEATIHVDVVQETTSIVLHARELLIKSAAFVTADDKSIDLISFSQDVKMHTLHLTFSASLPRGQGRLDIRWQGSHNNQMAGFYRSTYTDIEGKQRVMVSTQFESVDARRCFPCVDEPAVKAIFELTLVIPRHLTAISNMPELESLEIGGGKRRIHFLPTPRMSTYLVAVIVGEFDYLQGRSKNGVICRVYTPPGKAVEGKFALKVAERALDLYDDFFGIPYPLPKLDMIAIPEFAMGAMENWGAVTYREVYLLIDEQKASSQQRQGVAVVVAHELAHSWFGNLVSPVWWDDLWLNEGFASWTENYCTDQLFPDWCMWEQFTVDDQNSALNLDSLRSSHPIQVPIAHAEEVEQIFDAISYSKGNAVVRMLYAVLGEHDFKHGLQLYMQRHKYGNTETFDLWNAWETVSKKPIGKIMASWTEQMGYPLVRVHNIRWEGSTARIDFSQEWFLVEGQVESKEEQEKTWTIPLLFGNRHNAEKPSMQLVGDKRGSIEVKGQQRDEWIKLNLGQHAPLRVLYPAEMLAMLAEGVRQMTLPAVDRAGLLLDCFNLNKCGALKGKELLHLMQAYQQEDNSTVWEALAMVLTGFDKLLLQAPELRGKFAAFASSLIKPAAHKVGWEPKENDGHLSKLLRATLIGLLARFCYAEPDVVGEAKKRFDRMVADPTDHSILPSEYKVAVLSLVLKTGDKEEFEACMKIFNEATSSVDKRHVYMSIGHIAPPQLKRRVLEWALRDDAVKLQDFFYPIGSVSASSHEGLELAFDFFRQNFGEFREKLKTASSSLMDACIAYCCGGFSSHNKADEIEAFFAEHPAPQSARRISQTLEKIRVSASWLERFKGELGSNSKVWSEL